LFRNGQGADSGLDRFGQPDDLQEATAFKGTLPQRITEYHDS
jgi:hypothetical protein